MNFKKSSIYICNLVNTEWYNLRKSFLGTIKFLRLQMGFETKKVEKLLS